MHISAVGSILNVIGLYAVLWGKKGDEANAVTMETEAVKESEKNVKNDVVLDLELQANKSSNGKPHVEA